MNKACTHLFFVLTALLLPAIAFSQDSVDASTPIAKAEGATLSRAVGHYARARTLLVAAIREFDKANQMVNPDAVLDSNQWRKSLLERTSDLERILDPQPRVSASGVRFDSTPKLLGEASRR